MKQEYTWSDIIPMIDRVIDELDVLMRTYTHQTSFYAEKIAIMMQYRQHAIEQQSKKEMEQRREEQEMTV